MKRVFRTNLTVRLWAVMVLSLFAASCSNDAFFGFDEDYELLDNDYALMNNGDFIDAVVQDLKIFPIKINDRGLFDIPEYETVASRISFDSYTKIRNMMIYSNKYLNGSQIRRLKSSNNEGVYNPIPNNPDCFIYAFSNYGNGAPSFNIIRSECDRLFPQWRTYGVPESVQSYIIDHSNVPYSITTSGLSRDCSLLNALVFVNGGNITVNGNTYQIDHCVNGIYYYHNVGGVDVIMYFDYKSWQYGLATLPMIYKIMYNPEIL